LLARIKRWCDGNVLLIISAVFFIAVGSILASLVFSSVLWSGTAVQGVDRGGIVYYTYDGQTNSLDDTSRFYSHTVYLDPERPDTSAVLGDPARKVFDVASVAIPFLIALVIIAAGVRRERQFRRGSGADDPSVGGFGHGLDPEVVHRLIERRRRADRGA
jgi:hypothetical protein